MYRYDEFDRRLLDERVAQFRDQVRRRLAGELSEEEFRPLRLRNGVYLQLHAYMFRIAIPYGVLNPAQLRMLAHVARRYDRGFGHFTTRTNLQLHWMKLEDLPDAMADLARVEMHAFQTSGNCVRNITADPWAGVAPDEVEDPRVWCEIIRQWSTFHPEFTFLPRKFKIAVTGGAADRAAVRVYDIGLRLRRNAAGEVGFEVIVGGGLGRTPILGKTIRDFLPKQHLLSYLEAILRVYNEFGRRDNVWKARIKILVQQLGAARMAELVEAEWAELRDGALTLPAETVAAIAEHFAPPAYGPADPQPAGLAAARLREPRFAAWLRTNVAPHRVPGYAIATISLKPQGETPGDASAEQMEVVADLAERYSHGEARATYEQSLLLPHVRLADLPEIWRTLEAAGLGTANIGRATDIIACPGLDYCSLANARSIPVARRLSLQLDRLDRAHDLGALQVKISGCINACGHHHVGHIGILGVDKNGEEFYQITLGGSAADDAALGSIIGPAVSSEAVVGTVSNLVESYVALRRAGEPFLDTYRRIGLAPFKERLHAAG